MKSSILSVVIPTRNRPVLLAQALKSISQQSILPFEVIVGDDSDDPSVNEEIIISARLILDDVVIKHLTTRSGGQSANVQRLYQTASTQWICLLHDDDELAHDAISVLLDAYKECYHRLGYSPVLIYGQQIIIDEAGNEMRLASDALNSTYHRTANPRKELLNNSRLAAILQQAPNDGYIVSREAALTVGYDLGPAIGDACDLAFGIGLSKLGKFHYVPSPVSKYRITQNSVLRGSGKQHYAGNQISYRLVKSEACSLGRDSKLVRSRLQQLSAFAVNEACQAGFLKAAWKTFLSVEHLSTVCTIRFWMRLLRLVSASSGAVARQLRHQ